jgi:uncharacterized repeat protein (TIGR01451 family)
MKSIILLIIQLGLMASVYGQINLSNGLRAQYDFSGNANDLTGNGFNGTVNGATLTTDRFGNPNSAYYLNGINQNIEVSGFQNMINGDDISISLWTKVETVKTQGMVVLFPDNINDRLFAGNYYSHNGVSSLFWDYGNINNNGRLSLIGTFHQPVWEHYVFITNATNNQMQVYRNGYLILQKSGNSIIQNKNRTLCFGGNMAGQQIVNCFLHGSIDDIRIYNRVLNPAEVMALYHGYYESTVKDLRVFVTNWPNPRPGFNEELYVIYQNVGTTNMPATVEFRYDTTYTFLQVTPPPDSVNGNYLAWNLANLPPGGQGVFTVLCNLNVNVPLGTQLMNHAIIHPVAGDTVPWDNYDTLYQTVVGSYDPNDMLVSPAGDVTEMFVENGHWLTYTIRFQNTGTASAINVKVENQLESDFWISSVEIIGASHNFTWSLSNSNKLTFLFNNINLPDSGSNLMGSNGFVMYRIKGLPTLQAGDQLTNNASIFFDFNAPIQTNTVVTNIVAPTGLLSPASTVNRQVQIFPNPFSEAVNLVFPADVQGKVLITIMDLQGKPCYVKTVPAEESRLMFTMHTDQLSPGIYILKAEGSSFVLCSKLVKKP